jgi:anti-sigma B factor antagonist
MPLVLMLRHAGPVAVVGVRGPLTLSPTLRGFKKQIERFCTAETKGIVLDLSEVPQMDSAGIGELVAMYSSAKRRGADVALIGVHPRLAEMLRVTRVDALFTTCRDEAAAIAALSKGV